MLIVSPWEWVADPDIGGHWRSPGGTAIGALDRRSNTQSGIRGGIPQGVGFFAYPDGATLPSGSLNLGSDIERLLTATERDGLLKIAGITARSTDSVLDMIRGSYLNPANYDPAGETKCKPLRISRRNGLKCSLGGFGRKGLIIEEGFTPTHPSLLATLAVRFADYRRNRAIPDVLTGQAKTDWIQSFRTKKEKESAVILTEQEARSRWLAVIEQWTGYDMKALYGRQGNDLLPAVVPPEYRDGTKGTDGWRLPQTVITEPFAGSSIANFTQVDPTTGGFTESAGVLKRGSTAAASQPAVMRHDTALSTANHYSEIVQVTQPPDSLKFFVPAVRFAAAAKSFYCYIVRGQGNLNNIYKVVNGVLTALFTGTYTSTWPQTVRLRHNNADLLEGLIGGTVQQSGTDSSITGNLQVGIAAHIEAANHGDGDDFEGGDLAGALIFRRRIEGY